MLKLKHTKQLISSCSTIIAWDWKTVNTSKCKRKYQFAELN